jgi:hypothetical protein
MFCPQCGSEYREGFTACDDCGVALVAAPAAEGAEPAGEEWVTVLETGDPGLLALAHSLLDSEGLTARFPGEGLQSLFGAGTMGSGFNIAVGPAAIQVPAHEAEQARELLAGLEQSGEFPEDGEEDDEEDTFPDAESPLEEPS